MLIGLLVVSAALKIATVVEQVSNLVGGETVAHFSFDVGAAAAPCLVAVFASAALVLLMAFSRLWSEGRRRAAEEARRQATEGQIAQLQASLGDEGLSSQLAQALCGPETPPRRRRSERTLAERALKPGASNGSMAQSSPCVGHGAFFLPAL